MMTAQRIPEEPLLQRDGAQLKLSEGPARCPLVWTLHFPSIEWAAHVERRLWERWRLLKETLDVAFEIEQGYAREVRRVTDLVRSYLPKGLVKFQVEGVAEAFGECDA